MNKLIRELSAEAHEIMYNINQAARNMEITAAQRDELLKQVDTDVTMKLTLAKNLLYTFTGRYYPPTKGA